MQTTTTLAADFDTTPRTLRKFLRAQDMGVGKGSRYSLPTTKREVASLKKRFTAWEAEVAAKKAPKVEVEAPAEDEVDTFGEDAPDFDDIDCPLDA